ncbi:hypothetical protein MNBD_PLANCTO02-3277 [hydrothermal vent metagenome]|uniref:Uncharacterized protein n=1 Tax=hydrothermal vent metagenome TaxID=652676 RepID=A0A3B1DX44_9ZZZZ
MSILAHQAEPEEKPIASPLATSKAVSGKKTVVLMFLFGTVLTSFLYFYWTAHTARFRSLQDAIAHEFEGSMPRVEGGQRKMHLELSPFLLRVTMKVKFDPTVNILQAEKHAKALTTFIQKYENVKQFDKLEYHFYQLNPEDKIKQKTLTYETKSLVIQ